MSKIGYQSPVQEELNISYNDLDSFIKALVRGITTPHPLFTKIGLKDSSGYPCQISDGILQIENELYDIVRPKRKGNKLDRPVELLSKQGIGYIEIRGIDVNPFDPAGISKSQMALLDVFLLLCLVKESDKSNKNELLTNIHNQELVVGFGRDPGLKISIGEKNIYLSEYFKALKDELLLVADYTKDAEINEAINYYFAGEHLSAKVLDLVEGKEFKDVGYEHSVKIKSSFSKEFQDIYGFEKKSADSLEAFNKLNSNEATDIREFVKLYNDKIKEMK